MFNCIFALNRAKLQLYRKQTNKKSSLHFFFLWNKKLYFLSFFFSLFLPYPVMREIQIWLSFTYSPNISCVVAGQQLWWNQSINTSRTAAVTYILKRSTLNQPKGYNETALGTTRTKYPYQKDQRGSHETSPPSQASSGQTEDSYHTVATLNHHPVTRSLTEVVTEWQCCPLQRDGIHHKPVGKTLSKPEVTLRLKNWQLQSASAVFLLEVYLCTS